ncbi:MAG: hypothetical protein JWP32_2517 [Schumannella sp.]|nr:hypothetical protein [Schumannella sp.]
MRLLASAGLAIVLGALGVSCTSDRTSTGGNGVVNSPATSTTDGEAITATSSTPHDDHHNPGR